MRKILYFTFLAVVCLGCEPHVKSFYAVPPSLQTIGKTTLYWRLSAGTAELSANPPALDLGTTPTLNPPKPVDQEGQQDVTICKTTTFKLELHYGGEATVTVPVAQPCPCAQQVLTFSGTCFSKDTPPSYPNAQTALLQTVGPGTLKDLYVDATFPVIVHHGYDIGFNASGHPITLPFNPPLPAAGTYSLSSSNTQVCKDAGAGDPGQGGPVPAPDVHLTVFPNCI